MFNLAELNELYNTPEGMVNKDVKGSLQGINQIGDEEQKNKSYAQTGVINPNPVNTGGQPEQNKNEEINNQTINQNNQGQQGQQSQQGQGVGNNQQDNLQNNQQDNQQNQGTQGTGLNLPDNQWSSSIVNPNPDEITPKMEIKSFINPITGQIEIGYLKPDPKLTPEEQNIINSISKDKKAGDASFNAEWLLSTDEVSAVLNILNKHIKELPKEAVIAIQNELNTISKIKDIHQRIDALNKFKVKLGKLLEDSKLPGKLYAKQDPSAKLLYEYISKAKKLNGLIWSNGQTLLNTIQENSKKRFEIGTFNPKQFGTSFKSKTELWSNPIFLNEIENLKKKAPELYYVLMEEKSSPILGTYEKKILRKIYETYVKPLQNSYYKIKKTLGEAAADRMFPQFKKLKNLTDLQYRTYLDDILDKLYQPPQIDGSHLNMNLWKMLGGYSINHSTINLGTLIGGNIKNYGTYTNIHKRTSNNVGINKGPSSKHYIHGFNGVNF